MARHNGHETYNANEAHTATEKADRGLSRAGREDRKEAANGYGTDLQALESDDNGAFMSLIRLNTTMLGTLKGCANHTLGRLTLKGAVVFFCKWPSISQERLRHGTLTMVCSHLDADTQWPE